MNILEVEPDSMAKIGDVMSNFDHAIENGAEERLKREHVTGNYPAWNFHATVWFDGRKFKARIMRYHSHVNTLSAETLQEIMDEACELYGYE